MYRRQNIILFSAGESIHKGKVDYIEEELLSRDISCVDWRDLFKNAYNKNQISLLPSLIKKIPTFDFAIILADGVDELKLRGQAGFKTMRDNVLFELGLCVMGLGVERVILLAEDTVRIPDDLMGKDKIGIEYITYSSQVEFHSSVKKVGDWIQGDKTGEVNDLHEQIDMIVNHVYKNAEAISPIYVGASVASAEAYFLNFVVRFFENIDKGIRKKNNRHEIKMDMNKIQMKIILPFKSDLTQRDEIVEFYEKEHIEEYMIENAGVRDLFFHGKYDEKSNSFIVCDIPTSITASYSVVDSVMNIDADEDFDINEQKRFIAKEMDVYEYTLKKLCSYSVAEKRLTFIKDEGKKKKILKALKNVQIIRKRPIEKVLEK